MAAMREILEAFQFAPDIVGSDALPDIAVGPATLDRAVRGGLSFCTAATDRPDERLRASQASMVIVDGSVLEQMRPRSLDAVVVRSENARLDYIRVLSRFFAPSRVKPGIHPSAVIGARVDIGEGVTIGPLCTIADDVAIGPGPYCMRAFTSTPTCASGRALRSAQAR